MALISKASLLMVPSTYEQGTLYNVLPSGNRAPDSTDQNSGYDQTRADFTFDRGSNAAATRIGSDGLIKKYRENKLLYSQDYTQSAWNKTNCTITTNYIANPVDGSVNAPNITIDQTAGSYEKTMTQQNLNFVSGNVYCVSVWMKAGSVSSDTLRILAYDGGQVHSSSYIYLDDIENTPCEYEAGNDGWNRFYFYFKAANTAAGYIYIFNYAYGQVTNAGTNLYIYGAQWELGTYPTDVLTSGATTGKAGVLIDLPRINYDANGENGALLLEPQRANSTTYSEYIGASGVGALSVTNNTNATKSPEGLYNATLIAEDTTTGYHRIGISHGSMSNATKTFSIFAKWAGGSGRKWLTMDNGPICYFDLENGTKGNVGANCTADIEDYGNGWYRCHFTHTSSSSGTLYIGTASANGGAGNHLGNGEDAMYFYGVQAEDGASYVSSYIPNHGESGGVTRAADSCFADNIGQTTAYTIFLDYGDLEQAESNFQDYISFQASGSNQNGLRAEGVGSAWRLYGYGISGSVSFPINGSVSAKKKAIVVSTAGIKLFEDGALADEDLSGMTIPALGAITTKRGTSAPYPVEIKNSFKQIAVFNEALSNAECISLTS